MDGNTHTRAVRPLLVGHRLSRERRTLDRALARGTGAHAADLGLGRLCRTVAARSRHITLACVYRWNPAGPWLVYAASGVDAAEPVTMARRYPPRRRNLERALRTGTPLVAHSRTERAVAPDPWVATTLIVPVGGSRPGTVLILHADVLDYFERVGLTRFLALCPTEPDDGPSDAAR